MGGSRDFDTLEAYGRFVDEIVGRRNARKKQAAGSQFQASSGRFKEDSECPQFVHVDIEPTQIGRVFNPDYGIVSDVKAALELFVEEASNRRSAGAVRDWSDWTEECSERKRTMLRRSDFDNVPVKPQRVYQEMNRAFGRDTGYVTTIGVSQIAGAQFRQVYKARNWINCGQAGPLGWTTPAALGVRARRSGPPDVCDYDFQFLIEELAVGAQFNLQRPEDVEEMHRLHRDRSRTARRLAVIG